MTNRIDVIANELIYHHMQPGGTCTCGRPIRIGSSIQVHRAEAVVAAMLLDDLGLPLDHNHDAVQSTFAIMKGHGHD